MKPQKEIILQGIQSKNFLIRYEDSQIFSKFAFDSILEQWKETLIE